MNQDRIVGKLSLYNGKQLLIPIMIEKLDNILQFQLDTGCTYTQISLELAKELGLKSHKKIIGKSAIGNGQEKYDYLCRTSITIGKIEKNLVVKVSPGQPLLLGLDAMFIFDMQVFVTKQEYSIATNENYIVPSSFHLLEFSRLMTNLKIKEEDLESVENLPIPEIAYSELLNIGKSNIVLDLGITC